MSDSPIPRLIVAEWAPDARACAAIHERVSATMACAALDHLEAAEARAEKAEAALAEARADVVAAAGELLVAIPEPGSEAARLLLANVAMRRERDNASSALSAMRAKIGEVDQYWLAKFAAETSRAAMLEIVIGQKEKALADRDLELANVVPAVVIGQARLSAQRAIALRRAEEIVVEAIGWVPSKNLDPDHHHYDSRAVGFVTRCSDALAVIRTAQGLVFDPQPNPPDSCEPESCEVKP